MAAPPFGNFSGTIGSPIDGEFSWVPGGGSSPLVPSPFVVAINGRPYLHDLEFKPWKRQAMRATTTQTTRTQADSSNEPGEQSLSTEQLWRRTQDSWHLGAGQQFVDRKTSSEFSFRSSKGIDCWTQWQLQALPHVTTVRGSAQASQLLVTVGSHVYFADGTTLRFSNNDLSSWTAVTGMPGTTISSLTTDGFNVYVACGTSGVYTTTEGAAGATQLVTSSLDSKAIVRFVMGRLMVGNLDKIYNVTSTSPAVLPSALMQSNYSNLLWVDFSTGNGCIFAAGNSGNVGVVYSIQIETDGTSLSSPIICGQMPNGETVNAIYGYAGSGVMIGTSRGWRFSEQALANDVAGTVSLTIGPVTLVPGGCTSFSGFDRFVWTNYDNYDTSSTGLIRIDPSVFTADLTPAWATDRMTDETSGVQGHVTGICHFTIENSTTEPVPIFAVTGVGIFGDDGTFERAGLIDSGLITYGIADDKRPVFVDLTFPELVVNSVGGDGWGIETWVSLDGGEFQQCGIANSAGETFAEFMTPQTLCQTIEVRHILHSDIDSATSSTGPNTGQNGDSTPTLTRYTLRSVPVPAVPTDWNVAIQLREKYLIKDVEHYCVPSQEYQILDAIRASKQIVTLQVGNIGPYITTIESIDWIPEQNSTLDGELNGVAVITLRTVV